MKARRCLIFFFDVNHAFRFENEEKCTFVVELLLTLFAVCPRSSLLKKFPADFFRTTCWSLLLSLTSNRFINKSFLT
jgi:hypothetical protein